VGYEVEYISEFPELNCQHHDVKNDEIVREGCSNPFSVENRGLTWYWETRRIEVNMGWWGSSWHIRAGLLLS